MVTSIDPQDVPLESAIYSENLDNNALGRLQGILVNSLKSSTIGENAIGINNWLRRETGEYDLIYTDGTNVKSVRDFYGSPTENTEIASKVPTSMVRMNRGMHMGTGSDIDTLPQYLGWGGDFRPFGGIGVITPVSMGGANDTLLAKGFYDGTDSTTLDDYYFIEIVQVVPTLQFTWYKNAGVTSSPIESTGDWQEVDDGLYIKFAEPLVRVVGDFWSIQAGKKNAVGSLSSGGVLNTYEDTYGDGDAFDNTRAYAETGKFKLYISTTNYGDVANNDIIILAGDAITTPESFDRRITGINIYRSEDSTPYYRWKYSLVYDGIQETLLSTRYVESSTSFSEKNAGSYRLVKSILIGNGDEWASYVNTFADFENSKYVICDNLTDDSTLAFTSVSYEQNSGVLENADTNLPYYELGCTLNNSHFVAKCYVDKIPDAKMMLFRSVEFCYDVFDIYNDKMYLNIVPTAIAGYNNKIYAWDDNTTVIINASSLSIESVTHGTGCLSPLSWTIIDTLLDDKPYRALVWADSHDIYMDEGNGARPISDAIRTRINTTTVSWADMQHSLMNPILVFDAPKNTLLCITSTNYANTKSSAFAYHITSKRWDYYPDFCNYSGTPTTDRLCKSAFSGKNGETYSVNGYQVLNNFGGTFNRAWEYYSPELIFGLPKQPKKFYNIYLDKVETSGAVTATYSIDKGAIYRALTNLTEIKDVNDKWEKKNSIIIALSGTAGVNWVNAIELLHRRMVGVR